MKWIKRLLSIWNKSPFLWLLLISSLLLSGFGIAEAEGLYSSYPVDLMREPAGVAVFLGAKDGRYPWDLLRQEAEQAQAADGSEPASDGQGQELNDREASEAAGSQVLDSGAQAAAEQEGADGGGQENGMTVVGSDCQPSQPAETPEDETEPHWEQTYAFEPVTEEYFNDALFIGDSRMVGLEDYAGIADRATFYARTSLTVWQIFAEPKAFVEDKETGRKLTIEEALQKERFGKIYIMVGINELGRGTVESFAKEYENVINRLQELQPEAIIFIQGIMHVGEEKNNTDPIFNNTNIDARNNAISMLANNSNIFYVDGNPEVCDENGNLKKEWSYDQVHLLGVYYNNWKEFLLTKGILREKE